jgi:hypothetical protein
LCVKQYDEQVSKIGAIVVGIFSLLYSAFSVSAIISLLRIGGHYDLRMISGNLIFTYLWLSPLTTIGLFVSAFGLYKERQWGYILSSMGLILFLIGFVVVLIQHVFPNLVDSTAQLKSGWFVFYHMNLNIETIVAPILVIILLILLNLKSIRRTYR